MEGGGKGGMEGVRGAGAGSDRERSEWIECVRNEGYNPSRRRGYYRNLLGILTNEESDWLWSIGYLETNLPSNNTPANVLCG